MNKTEKAKIAHSLSSIAALKDAAVGDYAKGSAAMAGLIVDLLSNRASSEAYKLAYSSLKSRSFAASIIKQHAK